MKITKVVLLMAVFMAATVAGSFAQETSSAEPKVLSGCAMIKQDENNMVMQYNKNLRNVSWAEIILWCDKGGTFNTMGLNDPKDSAPEAFFRKLDKQALGNQYQVIAASTNPDRGRKYWTCDEFHIEGSTTIRDFNGLKARYVGALPLRPDGKPESLAAADIPKYMYKVKEFKRVSTLIYQKGKPVFLLDDPSGTTWINKNFQTGVDPTLTYEGMATLDKHLKHLPEGWKFRTVIIDQDLVIKADGAQRIMWDELGNAWDALEPGMVNFMRTAVVSKVLTDGVGANFSRLDNMHKVRYIEIFFAHRDAKTGTLAAEVYNSMVTAKGIPASKDTAPQAAVEGLDFAKMKTEFGLLSASLNGPKLWMPDWTEIDMGVQRNFNGIEAAWVATLNMDEKAGAVSETTPYKPFTIARKSRLGWTKGTTVMLLDDAEGNTWILKGYQIGVKPQYTYEQFMAAGQSQFKKLPPGWKFRVKVLEEDFIERPEGGVATIMADEFFNVYDKTGTGMSNYKP